MIEVYIFFTFGEAQIGEIIIDPGVPSMRCLFKTAQCSLEFAHMILSIKSLKSSAKVIQIKILKKKIVVKL